MDRKTWIREWGRGLLMAALIGGLVVAGAALLRPTSPDLAGKEDRLSFSTPSGETVSLSELKGQVILVNFWATWCPPCLEEMPSLGRLEAHFAGKPFRLFAITPEDHQTAIRSKVAGSGWPQGLVFGLKDKYLDYWDIDVLPVTFLIDSTGKVVKKYLGPQEWMHPAILQNIEQLLPSR